MTKDDELIKLDNDEDNNKNNDNDESKSNNSSSDEETTYKSPKRKSLIPLSVRKFGIRLPGMASTSKTNDDQNLMKEDNTTIHNMSNSNFSQMNVNFGIRKFDGTNWLSWKNQMLGYLAVKQCDYCLRTPRPRTDTVMQAAFDDRERFARGMLLCSMSDKVVIMVAHLKTSRDIWARLVESYEQTSKVSAVLMQRKFFEATMEDNETAMEFVSRVQSIYCQLLEAGSDMAESMLVARIIAGLGAKFHVFITNWSNNTELRQTLAELIPRLMSEEALLDRFKATDGLAMVNEARRPKARSTGAPQSSRPQRDSTKPKQDFQVSTNAKSGIRPNRGPKCYNCNVFGHISKNCPKPQKPRQNKPPAAKPEEAIVAEGVIAEANLTVTDDRWILDSGASDHMTNDKSSFASLKPSPKQYVRVGDNGELSVEGVGEIKVRSLVDGEYRDFVLKGVLYVPGLRRKLISLNVATSNGAIGAIESDRIVLSKGGRPLLVGEKSNGLYYVPLVERELSGKRGDEQVVLLNAETDESNNPTTPDQAPTSNDSPTDGCKLWHERMAHISRTTIARMKQSGSVDGLEGVSLGHNHKRSDRKVINCESCCLAKHARVAIPLSTRTRATTVGERVHLDICGPVGAATVAGSKYFILFKDEYSNFRFIYFMKSREEAFSLIKKCFAEIEANPLYKVRTMVSDNGSEFTSKRTQEYLKERSIVHVTSAPFTPQQNGFIERDNRTVMEACRSMLFHKRLPEMLWGEAAMTAVYILNRTINANTGDKTPFELFTSSKPRVGHMRVFGCVAFVKKQEKKRSGYQRKLDSRSEKQVFVGYERDYTYKLFCPAKKSFMLSREVQFDEREDIFFFSTLPQYANLDTEISNLRGSSVEEADQGESDDELNVAESGEPAPEEPTSYREAIEGPEANEWVEAMRDEYNSLIANNTWTLVELPPHKKTIKNRWVYKLKRGSDGQIARYKARLVAKGYSQRQGIDYTETFSPVVRMDSVRIILGIVAEADLEMIHFDIRTAFLYGDLDEEIYMTQPAGFESGDNRVCRLLKSLYGLKQASRVWNRCFVSFLAHFDLQPTKSDSCVLVRHTTDELLIISIYVDDGLACSNNKKLLDEVVEYLKQRFEITLMQAECFVGMQIQRERRERKLFIHQSAYIDRLIPRFNLNEAMVCSTPMSSSLKLNVLGEANGSESKIVDVPYREIIGSLMYLTTGTRPDIANAISILARFSNQPRLAHWHAARRVLKYVVATRNLALCYDGMANGELQAFADADYANCLETRRSMTGFAILRCAAAVVWKSTKQTTVAESTVEAEFVACSLVSKDIVWCTNFLDELRQQVSKPVSLKSDNQGAIRVIKNNQIHSKVKQLDIKMMAIREKEERGQIACSYVHTDENVADILTKPLPPKRFNYLRSKLGLVVIALLLVSSEAARINFNAKSLRNRPSQRLVLKVSSPCSDSQEVEKSIYGTVNISTEFKANATFVESTKVYCDDMWTTKVIPAVSALDSCLGQHVISKRDLGSAINAAVIVASAIAGVSNLIRGATSSLPVESDTDGQTKKIESLGKLVSQSAKSTLLDRAIMRRETSQEIAIVSDTAASHQEQVLEAVQSTPMLIWMTGHIMHELQAGVANLKAIRRQCILGRLATQELGEMLECPALTAIPPDATLLERIVVDATNNMVEFIFRSEEVIELDIERLSIWSAALVLLLLLLCMLCLNLSTIRSIHKRSKAGAVARTNGVIQSDGGSQQSNEEAPKNQLAAKISSSLLPLSRLAMEF